MHHPFCAHHHGQAAHSAYHRNGSGWNCRGTLRTEHPRTRFLIRAVRQGGRALHHVPRRSGNEPAGHHAAQTAVHDIRSAHVHDTFCHGLPHRNISSGILANDIVAAVMHTCGKHPYSLPYRVPLRTAATSERGSERGIVDDSPRAVAARSRRHCRSTQR